MVCMQSWSCCLQDTGVSLVVPALLGAAQGLGSKYSRMWLKAVECVLVSYVNRYVVLCVMAVLGLRACGSVRIMQGSCCARLAACSERAALFGLRKQCLCYCAC